LFAAFIALGLVFAGPVLAGDQSVEEHIRKLEEKVEALSSQQSAQLDQAVESYLDSSSAWNAADGDMQGITITAALTGSIMGTLDQDPSNRHAVSGDVDLGFHFQVTENLGLHITATAAAGGGSASTANTTPTFSGATDGIGTNGNVSTTGTGRAINIYEAYITHTTGAISWEIGALDPRVRFLQNAFADDENTQFTNNLFDDSPSVLWQTGASGAGVLGVHLWTSFGGDNKEMFTVSAAWFNPSGTFFNNGSLFLQFSMHMDMDGRGLNIRLMANLDNINNDSSGDATIAWGLSADMAVSDKIGVFLRIAGNDDDFARGNPVEFDASFGGQMAVGDEGNVVGLAIGLVSANDSVGGPYPEDLEITVEVYFKIMLEGGKMQVTPFVMYINEPGGGGSINDTLFILGVRLHVPF
jgi:hypothetical protein